MNIMTAGESHGKGLYAIVEGLPAGLKIDVDAIDSELLRRSGGFGRGKRQALECDRVEILSGVLRGETIGSPLTLAIINHDHENWKKLFTGEEPRPLVCPRPGHADLAGMRKYGTCDARAISERASARGTAIKVAIGALSKQYLKELGVCLTGYVRSVGEVECKDEYSFKEIERRRGERLAMMDREEEAVRAIEEAASFGDTLGGIVELRAKGLKAGFGSCMCDTKKLDAQIAFSMMSVQAIKGVEFGLGFTLGKKKGSEAHDEIVMKGESLGRTSNRAGGIEGGMSNGEEIVVRAAMKPIPTLGKGLRTIDMRTGEPAVGAAERADICPIRACEVILENVLATELLRAVLSRLGGDTLVQLKERYERL